MTTPMRPRLIARLYNHTARAWFLAAGASFLLPSNVRLGTWLPLHLFAAGAVTIAICGNEQVFALGLTAAPPPPATAVVAQYVLVNAGAALVAAGVTSGTRAVTAVGGAAFAGAIVLVGALLARARLLAKNPRYGSILALYACAIAAVLAGAVIGALLATGAIHDANTWLALRRAHMIVNVLGWASIPVVATFPTILPAMFRARAPWWPGTAVAVVLPVGIALAAAGLALDVRALAAVGGVLIACAALAPAWIAVRTMLIRRRHAAAGGAWHLACAALWFGAGSVWLATTLARGGAAFDARAKTFEIVFLAGWVGQSLLGAWLWLFATQRPGAPDERKRFLTAIGIGRHGEVAVLNAGLGLVVLGLVRSTGSVTAVGAWIAGFAATFAVGKTFVFPFIGERPGIAERAESEFADPTGGRP